MDCVLGEDEGFEAELFFADLNNNNNPGTPTTTSSSTTTVATADIVTCGSSRGSNNINTLGEIVGYIVSYCVCVCVIQSSHNLFIFSRYPAFSPWH